MVTLYVLPDAFTLVHPVVPETRQKKLADCWPYLFVPVAKYHWKVISFLGSAYPDVGLFCGVIFGVTVVNVRGDVLEVVPPMSVASRYHWICVPDGNVFAGTSTCFAVPDMLIPVHGSEVDFLQ